MTSKIKVYELAKELGQDSQHLVDVVQRLGIDIKNSMSVLGSEEVRTVRDYYKKLKPLTKSVAMPKASGSPMTEKRVGATVIRRRSAKSTEKSDAGEAPEELVAAEEAPAVEEVYAAEEETEVSAEPVEAAPEEEEDAVVEEVEVEEIQLASPAPVPVSPPPASAPVRAATAAPVRTAPITRAPTPAAPSVVSAPPKVTAPPPPPPPKKVIIAEIPPKPRRIFPSIIKKVATEQYLGETVGPKVEKRERPKPIPVAIPVSGLRPRAPIVGGVRPPLGRPAVGTGTTPTGFLGPAGLKRVKEVEVAAAEAAAREAGKKRIMERQSAVFRSADYLKRELVHATKKKKNAINRPAMKTQITKPSERKRFAEMGAMVSVAELAKELGIKAQAVVSKLMALGVSATMNQVIDYDTATLVAHEFGYEVRQKVFKETDFVPTVDLAPENLKPRAPVVTIMGHVDHGKTSLLDAIRKTKVASGEAGGITQHVGAYTVKIPKGTITFVDTPGHEAFTAMRARGAKVTDLVIVVVSATDGVMPQTLESISHAQAAGVPIIVAVNKIDLPDGNSERIKQTLAGHNLNPEEWGGETIYVPVSAKTGFNLDKLLESVLLQAEMLELKANYDAPARGTVIESRLDKNRGPVASILVQHGLLKTGALAVCGTTYGKIRAMTNSFGQKITEAGPSVPVEILGLPAVPSVGDDLFVVADEKTARELTTARSDIKQALNPMSRPKVSIEEMMAAMGGEKELRIILKADVQGSAEALKDALGKFPTNKVKMKILHVGTGGITESDVMLAAASKAVILGFNIRPEIKAQKLAEAERIEIRTYTIIYDLLGEVKNLLEGLLDKIVKEKIIGRAEVRDVFTVPKVGTIAGSAVVDGKVIRGCFLRLLRDSRVVYEGKISSLRRFKEDVKEVSSGFECGIGLENFSDLKLGDQFEAFLKEESQGTL